MGVPGFFLWLVKKYKNNKFVINIDDFKNKLPEQVKWLCLDTNCLLHPKCFEVLSENVDFKSKAELEEKMITRGIEYIEDIIKVINPEGVNIAIDGVAPVAKIKQQRSRRFKSVADRDMFDRLKKKHGIEIKNSWNNSAITPGTDFMYKITKKIKEWCEKQTIPMIFSSANTPGEGEHKILDFIRNETKKGKDGPYVIYGLDADLLFLSMATQRDDIYLLREANQINKNSEDTFNIVDIKEMKNCVVDTMTRLIINKLDLSVNDIDVSSYISKYNLSGNDLVNDFIFICYFLGNDFLPHFASLNIYKDAIDDLLGCYTDTFIEELKNIISFKKGNVMVNEKFLRNFLKKLVKLERDIYEDFPNNKKRFQKLEGSEYEIALKRVENLIFKIHDPVKFGVDNYDKYKGRYYEHFFGCNIKNTKVEVAYNYLKGILWVTRYYFVGVPSWEYYYPYDHAPFMDDLLQVSEMMSLNKIDFKIGEPLLPYQQLLAVLPPQSTFLLPEKFKYLMTHQGSPLIHLYPRFFEQDFLYKKQYWMGIPKLPYLDIDAIKSVYNNSVTTGKIKLTKQDIIKNEKKEEYKYNYNV